MYTGSASSFEKAGFKTIGAHAPHRPIMRLDLKRSARSNARSARSVKQTRKAA
jgi:hypothetical protein